MMVPAGMIILQGQWSQRMGYPLELAIISPVNFFQKLNIILSVTLCDGDGSELSILEHQHTIRKLCNGDVQNSV